MQNNIQVGKFTLESLTTGMYSDSKIVYREYIQNAVDSLEQAVNSNIINSEEMRIEIIVDEENAHISIKDNGVGITESDAKSTLINVGDSKKRHTANRGFRGIGRLGGMSYCDTLSFTTSAKGENSKTTITFDCKKLRTLLVPGANDNMDLVEVLNNITRVVFEYEEKDSHYFVVDMYEVSSFSDLLNIESAKSYISQVAPLPYSTKSFLYTKELHDFLNENGYTIEEFPIFIGTSSDDMAQLYKPNRSHFHSNRNKMQDDDISKMQYFDITVDNELLALGWYGDCNWYGMISEPEIAGFRVRKGNILIGDSKTISNIYAESRFNGWTQGELFIVTDKLIPNARRDDFEQNECYFKLIEALRSSIGVEITKTIRDSSQIRNDTSAKALAEIERQVEEANEVLESGFNSSVDKNRLISDLSKKKSELKSVKPKSKNKETIEKKKKELSDRIDTTIETVSESNNYKINRINSGIDKKSKRVLGVVSNILSEKLSKRLVDEIIEEIIDKLNGK